MAGGMTEIYQEGLRIPPIRIAKNHEILDDVLDLVLLNVRVPEERKGDYMAQIAANKLGARRLQELFTKWTREQISEGCTGIIEAVTRRMRAGIVDLPGTTSNTRSHWLAARFVGQTSENRVVCD